MAPRTPSTQQQQQTTPGLARKRTSRGAAPGSYHVEVKVTSEATGTQHGADATCMAHDLKAVLVCASEVVLARVRGESGPCTVPIPKRRRSARP